MVKISEAFASKFLKAADLGGRTARVVINLIKTEEIGDGERKELKLVMYFEGKDRGLVLNKTNAATIAMAFGDDTDAWQGAAIELFPQAVSFNGQMVPAIRVRVPAEEPRQNGSGTGGATFAPNARQQAMAPPADRFAPLPHDDPEDSIPF